MPSAKRTMVAAAGVGKRFAALKGDRLAIAIVGDFSALDQVADIMGAINVNAALLETLDRAGQLNDLYELEEVEEGDSLRERLGTIFNEVLHHTTQEVPRLILWGFEILISFGVNLRWIRQYAVNDRPIGLLIPGTVHEGSVWFYDVKPIDCEFDQIWEVIS